MVAVSRALHAVLLLIGAVQLGQGWAGFRATVLITIATLVPYGLALMAAGRRATSTLAAPAVLVLLGVAGVLSGVDWRALRDGIPRLLTAPSPAPATADLLTPGVLLGAVVGSWVGVRLAGSGGGRFAPLVGGTTLYLGGALLSGGGSDRHGLAAVALASCAAAAWVVSERPGERRLRMLARAVPGTALAIAAAALAATVLPAGGEFDPRHLVSPPLDPVVEPNPLPRVAGYLKLGDQRLLRHSDGRPLRLVTLPRFDGSGWRAEPRYRPLDPDPAPSPRGIRRDEVADDIVIDALRGRWVPTPATPTAVSIPDVLVDPESGSLLAAAALTAGQRYQVRGFVDTPVDTELAVAAVPAESPYRELPRLPYVFADYAQQVVRGGSTPFEQAVLIENAVRGGARLDPNSPAGSSYARVEAFLSGRPGVPGAGVGGPEQFAAAFAVLARAAGLPTRLVVGFRPGVRQADGTWAVRGRDAHTWPEVNFAGIGWVPFDPTPGADSAERYRQVLDRARQNQPPPAQATPPQPVAIASASPSVAQRGQGGPGGVDLGRLAAIGGLVALIAVAGLALARATRRWGHRRAGARGAWSELLDLLILLGRRPPRWHTAPAIAGELAAAVPAGSEHPAFRLAWHADRAAFAPYSGPPSGSTVDSAWREVRLLSRAVRRAVPWYRRLTWPLDPRPLLRR